MDLRDLQIAQRNLRIPTLRNYSADRATIVNLRKHISMAFALDRFFKINIKLSNLNMHMNS